MRHFPYYRHSKLRYGLKRKLMAIAFFCLVAFFSLASLTLWLGAKAFDFASRTLNTPKIQNSVFSVIDQIQGTPKVLGSCWDQTQNIFSSNAWLQSSLGQNLDSLKKACLDRGAVAPCQGENCPPDQNKNEI